IGPARNPKEPLGIEAADTNCSLPRGDEAVDLLLSWTWLAAVIWLIARAFQQRGLLQSLQAPPSRRWPIARQRSPCHCPGAR
ncbi:MAG: hypothetical protein WAM72_12825, partial [Xanthobacteraceae bacterium]